MISKNRRYLPYSAEEPKYNEHFNVNRASCQGTGYQYDGRSLVLDVSDNPGSASFQSAYHSYGPLASKSVRDGPKHERRHEPSNIVHCLSRYVSQVETYCLERNERPNQGTILTTIVDMRDFAFDLVAKSKYSMKVGCASPSKLSSNSD